MATQQTRPLEWLRCLGRDGWDSPLEIPEELAVEALNWRFTGALGKRREGGAAATITGMAGTPFGMAQFIPGQDPTVAELIIVDTAHNFYRVPVAAAIALPFISPSDNPSFATAYLDTFVQHNGKMFIAYDGTQNRLHVYDPASGNVIRRVGILVNNGGVFISNFGAGAYPATLRYYRVQSKTIIGGVTVRVSNLSNRFPFTPSGAGAAARVHYVGSGGVEGDTHWVVYGSADDLAYYNLSGDIAFPTVDFDDTNIPAVYPLNPLAPLVGANTPWPSVKFLGSDGLHLFGFGVYETSPAATGTMDPRPGRVYFSPALGTSDQGDDERVSDTLTQRGWIDCNPQGGGVDRGISGPLNNRMYVFQSKGIYMLVPTGDPIAPFARVVMNTSYGSVSHWSQVIGEDQDGQPCLYFLDPADGPRRISVGRTIEWLGKDVNDFWKQVNLNASIPAFGVYDSARKLVLWWISIGADVKPTQLLVFDVTRSRVEAVSILRYGWSRWFGAMSRAHCAVMFSRTLAAVRSQDLVPYVGSVAKDDASILPVLRNDGTLNTDAGDPYQSAITSSPYVGGTLRRKKRIMEAFLLAKAGPATVTQTLIKNFGESTEVTSKSIAAVGTETRVRKFFDETDAADLIALQIMLGDSAALDQAFEIDQWIGADELEKGAR